MVRSDWYEKSGSWSGRTTMMMFSVHGPYSDISDLRIEALFVKEIRCVIEWFRENKTADQLGTTCYKFLVIQQIQEQIQRKLIN